MKKGKINKIVLLFIILFALISIIIGFIDFYKIIHIFSNKEATTGIIIQVRKGGFMDKCVTCSPFVFQYADRNGKTYINKQDIYFSPNYDVGQNVKIIYNKSNPVESILEYTIIAEWIKASILFFGGFFLSALMIKFIFKEIYGRKEKFIS